MVIPSTSGCVAGSVRLPVAVAALALVDPADRQDCSERQRPADVVMRLVGEYVLAGGETSGWERDQLASMLATAARDQWVAADWQETLDRLHYLNRPGGAFLGGNPVLAQAIAACRREVRQ